MKNKNLDMVGFNVALPQPA